MQADLLPIRERYSDFRTRVRGPVSGLHDPREVEAYFGTRLSFSVQRKPLGYVVRCPDCTIRKPAPTGLAICGKVFPCVNTGRPEDAPLGARGSHLTPTP